MGANSGGEWPPPADWNDGDAAYPHFYEVWLNGGRIKQTVGLFWPAEAPGWILARSHWVCLGTEPDLEYRVKIRAKLDNGSWSEFSNEIVVDTGSPRPYTSVGPATGPSRDPAAGLRHGSLSHPASRAVLAIRDDDPADICIQARKLNTSATWQEVAPPAAAMLADPPWNGSYLEYRKFFRGQDVASAGNPAFSGLDLVGEWPTTILSAADTEHAFSYTYNAHHVDPTWTHQWFITKDDWDPDGVLSWDDLEPVPFMTEIHGDPGITNYCTEAIPRTKHGRHMVVNVWGGHGGPRLPDGTLAGEFFVSCSDVEFV